MQGQAAAASSTSRRPTGTRCAGASVYVAASTRRRHHQVGGARDRQVGNPCERRGAWSYGHRHVDRFTARRRTRRLCDGVPMGRLGSPRSLPTRSYSSRRTKRHSSPAMSSTSTAATAPTTDRHLPEGISMTQHSHRRLLRSLSKPTASVSPTAASARLRSSTRNCSSTASIPILGRAHDSIGGVPLVFNQHFTGTMDHWTLP